MKPKTRSAQTTLSAVPRQCQLSMDFQMPSLVGMDINQRAAAVQALTTVLLQAADVDPMEADDVGL